MLQTTAAYWIVEVFDITGLGVTDFVKGGKWQWRS